MDIRDLKERCGECDLIEHCGEPYSEIKICRDERFENVTENNFLTQINKSKKLSKKARINDVAKLLNC
jgi:phage FluMu protein Com